VVARSILRGQRYAALNFCSFIRGTLGWLHHVHLWPSIRLIGPTGTVLAFNQRGVVFRTVQNSLVFQWVGMPSFSSVNGIPVVSLDGATQGALSPDNAYWSPGDSHNDSAFRVVVWVRPVNWGGNLFGKYELSGPRGREWLLQVESSDTVIGVVRDHSTNGVIKPRWIGLPPLNQWHMLAFTYDGSKNMLGMRLWHNAQPVDNALTQHGNYIAMENTPSPVYLGYSMIDGDRARFFEGELAGGRCGPIFTKVELNQSQLQSLYELCRKPLNGQ
jgi:hypothetical protein